MPEKDVQYLMPYIEEIRKEEPMNVSESFRLDNLVEDLFGLTMHLSVVQHVKHQLPRVTVSLATKLALELRRVLSVQMYQVSSSAHKQNAALGTVGSVTFHMAV